MDQFLQDLKTWSKYIIRRPKSKDFKWKTLVQIWSIEGGIHYKMDLSIHFPGATQGTPACYSTLQLNFAYWFCEHHQKVLNVATLVTPF